MTEHFVHRSFHSCPPASPGLHWGKKKEKEKENLPFDLVFIVPTDSHTKFTVYKVKKEKSLDLEKVNLSQTILFKLEILGLVESL